MPQAGVQPLNVYIPAEHLLEAHLMRPKLQAQIKCEHLYDPWGAREHAQWYTCHSDRELGFAC